MEKGTGTPYKSNYTIGIIFTVVSLLAIVGEIATIFFPSVECVYNIINLGSFVLFLVWFYRSHQNLLSFNTQGLKYTSGWAVGAFWIPILNLFRPYQIGQEVWKASDPEASTVGWKQSKNGTIVILWWAGFFLRLFAIFGIMGFGVSAVIQAGLSGVEPDTNTLMSAMLIPAIIIDAIYAVLVISMVVLVNDRQDEKAENLGLLQ